MANTNNQLLNALEHERRDTARALHDGVAQTTLQLGLQAGICRKLLERNNHQMLTAELANLEERIQLASRQIRQLIQDLRPPALADEATLNDHIQYIINIHLERGGPPVTYNATQNLVLSPMQVLGVSRIIQELLAIIRKQNKAEQFNLTVTTQTQQLGLTLTNDPANFDIEKASPQLIDTQFKVTTLQARIQAVHGTLYTARNGIRIKIPLTA